MREWIETNGLGGYASLSQKQKLQRKFHGLLIASRHPPVERWVLISNLIDSLVVDDKKFLLADTAKFSFEYFPTWTYQTPYGVIKKTMFMPHEQNTTVIKYNASLSKEVILNQKLLLNSRHFYDTNQEANAFDYTIQNESNLLRYHPHNIEQTVTCHLPQDSFDRVDRWQPYTYELDKNRNDNCFDHVLYLGDITKNIAENDTFYVVFTTEENIPNDFEILILKELQRRNSLLQQSQLPQQMQRLILASDRFIVKKHPYHTIIAGYHWFSDWGRDTLIALPGICLVTARTMIAKEILQGLATYSKQGIIPNTFDDRDNTPAYNTVDASLWYIDRVFQYLKYTNDKAFIRTNYSVLQQIISSYQNGTHHRIVMDDDYLISHDPGLTWMDVKLGDYYPTPRSRKAVEIQALWYNALRIMSLFAEINNQDNYYESLAERVKESFNQQFDRLYDVIDTRDETIRPNIIFLASMDFTMIPTSIKRQIVNTVEEKLFTLFGLRTLESSDPQYKGSYLGDYYRDIAYHNGTVWPWLMGSFIKAKASLKQQDPDWKTDAFGKYLSSLFHVYGTKWDGSIHEIFDAEPPYAPRGCISQAWSVAEILRAWVEDINGKRPPYEDAFLTNELSAF